MRGPVKREPNWEGDGISPASVLPISQRVKIPGDLARLVPGGRYRALSTLLIEPRRQITLKASFFGRARPIELLAT
jgi:hypothetical protein